MTRQALESLKIGYVPYSTDLTHPADRRRLAAWAFSKKISLNVANPLESDVLVLSNAANFGRWLSRATQPVILDLVDGYIGERPIFLKDFARNVLRSLRGTSNLKWITYSRHIRFACQKSDAVIVASPEQRETVLKFNPNVHVILDSHSELSMQEPEKNRQIPDRLSSENKKYLFWEGFGYTLKHFRLIARELDEFLSRENWGMYLVTVEVFPRWGGFLGKIDSQTLLKKWFPKSWEHINIVPWSIENLKKYAAVSECGIIPIDKSDKFAALKSENKLLSMWQLGLPVFFSNIPSYLRVARASNQSLFCLDNDEWSEFLDSLLDLNQKHLSGRNERGVYLTKFHTDEILMQKWSEVIDGLTGKVTLNLRSHNEAPRKSTLMRPTE